MRNFCRPYVDIMAWNDGVTGSNIPVTVKFPDGTTRQFVVDCGLFQEREFEELNNKLPFKPGNVDFTLVTHAHIDHIGRLPFMVKEGYNNNIYATEPTCKLLPHAIEDSFKILRSFSRRKNEKCLYEQSDVDKTLSILKPCKYKETFSPVENIKVTFFKNGHLVGAAVILVQISYPECEDINLLFTGDYNNKNIFFNVPKLPKKVTKLPITIIQESTYGYIDSSEIRECFEKNVKKCIDNNGTVVVLVASLGKAQEILYKLKKMQDKGMIDKRVPIDFDGKLAIKYTGMYINGKLGIKKQMLEFLPENLTLIENRVSRREVITDTNPKIIVTTSLMGTFGPAQSYIPKYITRKNALIHFTGYTAEGTLGYKLKNAEDGGIIEIRGVPTKKRAQVEYTTEYSAHAKADVIIDFLKQFTNLKLILFNHGTNESKKIIAERATREVKAEHIEILGRQYFFRVDAYGLVKTLSTKFD